MALRESRALANAGLPAHWRDVREWSMEKRQSYAMWVLDVESVLNSMARQLHVSLKKYPRQEHDGGLSSSPTRRRLPSHHLAST
ncbi:hypothetical protein AOLI_G00003560 [Acnodon oligacanthus]